MFKTLFICFLLVVFGVVCFSQTKRFFGRVYDNENRYSLDSVYFFNKKTNTVAHSNRDGSFSFNAYLGDSIIISKRGYRSDTITVFEEQVTNIGLVKRVIALEEVTITGKRSSPLEEYQFNKKVYKSIYLKGNKKNMVYMIPMGIAININKVFSALSKEGKDARRLQRTLDDEYQMAEVDAKFNDQLVKEITHLEGKDLHDFISEYRPDYEWIKSATDYNIMMYIKEKLQHFSKNRGEIRY